MALEDELFRALADPTRRSVFEALVEGEATVTALTERFHVSQPAISQHVAALKRAGLTEERAEGRRTWYRARMEGLEPLEGWLAHYRRFWRERLTKLDSILEEEP